MGPGIIGVGESISRGRNPQGMHRPWALAEDFTMTTTTRRTFVRAISYAGAAMPLLPHALARAVGANSKVRHVSFGGQGMAAADIGALAKHPAWSLHAVCDVDERRFAAA